MRLYSSITDAASEIQRDLYKSSPIKSTRVQHRTGIELKGREALGYQYALLEGSLPKTPVELVDFGFNFGFPHYREYPDDLLAWLISESDARLNPGSLVVTDLLHPALKQTLEGNYPSYTYPERLIGAEEALLEALKNNPDTRRAYWPIFTQQDAMRAYAPTRIPCSLGYELMIRKVGEKEKLLLFYLERSCDFDHFWLSDVWFAVQFQQLMAAQLGLEVGMFIHYILSFHSFVVEDEEVY